ncbi:hypothetical protein N0V88_004971 [Collariella sp. IMI 366227]|nr:hypothetical protein N0V88_004971 [Collariella sp. IMI 366227]
MPRKKAWRKNVDISEVQTGLEELNEQIIKGGVIAEKASDELFTIDVEGDAELPKRFNKHVSKGLKADEIIARRSAVPAVAPRKRAGDKTTDGVLPVKRQRTGYVTHKELTRIKRVADGHHQKTVAVAEAAEARADLSEWEDDSAWEGFESAGEELSVKAKRPRRKTQAERNRIKRRKEAEADAKHNAAMKKKVSQAERIKQIALEVAEKERQMELEKVEMSDASEEDSLRLLKPEGNLLKDRYRSMLVRGKMEVRRKIPFRKQARTKVTEKWTYKDFRLDFFNLLSHDLHNIPHKPSTWTNLTLAANTILTMIQADLDHLWRNSVPPEKVNLSLASRGRSFIATNPGCPFESGTASANVSKEVGVLHSIEIDEVI